MKFEINKTYTAKSICDLSCIFEAIVIKRTQKTVTVKILGTVKTKKVFINSDGNECAFFAGKYSMAPLFKANSLY